VTVDQQPVGQASAVNISVLQNVLRVEFANTSRKLADIESKVDKLAARCDKIPAMSSDLTACRRELAEVRDVVDNMAAIGSRRELEAVCESDFTAADDGSQRQWPELPVSSDDDWELLTALIVTEESLPPAKRPFSIFLARRIVSHCKNVKAPVKAAIRCILEERWAVQRMSMLGWRIINGRKAVGFKAFQDLRPFIITTMNAVCI